MNTIGTLTLCKREIWRFIKVWNQTVVGPVVTSLLFLAILDLAMGGETRMVDGLKMVQFIAPGLIMMAITQNAFANTSSSLMLGKIQGVIIDILMPPLSGAEITFALIVGGLVRGVMVGIVVTAALYLFVPFTIAHPLYAVFHVVAASIMLALLGVLAGVWSQSFDQLAALTNYIVTPLAFLSGTFYSIKQLPPFWYQLCHFNPMFYMIDGFRYAMTGYSDSSPLLGLLVLLGINGVLWIIVQAMITRGTFLKN
jgi:ABC-2 type transport system permease protein